VYTTGVAVWVSWRRGCHQRNGSPEIFDKLSFAIAENFICISPHFLPCIFVCIPLWSSPPQPQPSLPVSNPTSHRPLAPSGHVQHVGRLVARRPQLLHQAQRPPRLRTSPALPRANGVHFALFFCPRSNFQSWSSRLRFIIIPHFLLRVSILFAAWYQCLKTALTPFPPLIYGNKHKSEAVHTKMTPPFWLAFGFPRNRKNKTLSD